MAIRGVLAFFVTLVPCFLLLGSTRAQLSVDYYSKSCPNVEDIVRKEMVKILSVAPSLAAPFLRMHFHDCFVRVCLHIHALYYDSYLSYYIQISNSLYHIDWKKKKTNYTFIYDAVIIYAYF